MTLLGLDGRIEWVAEPDPADPPTVLVVPARTTEARERALRTCPGAATVCILGPSGPDPAGTGAAAGPDSVPFPDTVALADQARVALGDPTGPEADG